DFSVGITKSIDIPAWACSRRRSCTTVKRKASCGNGKRCSMLRINSTRSASYEALRRHPNFQAKSGSTSRPYEVPLAKTGKLWVKRAGDRRPCSFLARNFLVKTWNGHQKQKLTEFREHLSKSR